MFYLFMEYMKIYCQKTWNYSKHNIAGLAGRKKKVCSVRNLRRQHRNCSLFALSLYQTVNTEQVEKKTIYHQGSVWRTWPASQQYWKSIYFHFSETLGPSPPHPLSSTYSSDRHPRSSVSKLSPEHCQGSDCSVSLLKSDKSNNYKVGGPS